MSSSLGFFNKSSKQNLAQLLICFSQIARCVYILTKAFDQPSLHPTSSDDYLWSSRQDMKYKAYLYHMYCKLKNRIQRENQIIQSDQDVHVYGLWWMEWKLLLYNLSLYINSFESMAIFFFLFYFSWTFMCPHFFLSFFSILGPSCVHIFFFLNSPCLSSSFLNKNQRERPTHIVEHLFCGMSGWYNANFSKKHSKGVYSVHVNLDHESMKRIHSRVTTI